MSGFFRGTSLTPHFIVLGIVLALGIPWLADWLESRAQALTVGVVVTIVYFVLALTLATRHRPMRGGKEHDPDS